MYPRIPSAPWPQPAGLSDCEAGSWPSGRCLVGPGLARVGLGRSGRVWKIFHLGPTPGWACAELREQRYWVLLSGLFPRNTSWAHLRLRLGVAGWRAECGVLWVLPSTALGTCLWAPGSAAPHPRESGQLSPRVAGALQPGGHVPSGFLRGHFPQASAGFKGLCVCVYMYVCACTHLSRVCSERDLSTSHEKQGLCPPSAHSYPGSGAPGRLLPGLPAAAPARGASVTARDSRRGVGCGSMKAAPVPCGEMVGARLDAEVEGPQPQARAGGSPVPGSQQVCSCADLGPLTLSPRECTVQQGPCLARNVSSSSQATPASSGLCVALFPPCLHLCVVCAS